MPRAARVGAAPLRTGRRPRSSALRHAALAHASHTEQCRLARRERAALSCIDHATHTHGGDPTCENPPILLGTPPNTRGATVEHKISPTFGRLAQRRVDAPEHAARRPHLKLSLQRRVAAQQRAAQRGQQRMHPVPCDLDPQQPEERQRQGRLLPLAVHSLGRSAEQPLCKRAAPPCVGAARPVRSKGETRCAVQGLREGAPSGDDATTSCCNKIDGQRPQSTAKRTTTRARACTSCGRKTRNCS